MMRKFAIGITAVALSIYAGAPASTSTIANDALDDQADGSRARPAAASIGTDPTTTVVEVNVAPAAPTAPVTERVPSANPLWAMPLAQFPSTRERPIFSPSRRPPPSAVAPVAVQKVAVIPKPKEPERPQLTLVGTVTGEEDGFGIFLDQSTKAVLRLRVGEEIQGWRLRSVQGREAALEKDQQVVTLALPQPGLLQVSGEAPPPPPSLPRLRR